VVAALITRPHVGRLYVEMLCAGDPFKCLASLNDKNTWQANESKTFATPEICERERLKDVDETAKNYVIETRCALRYRLEWGY
jgi:hypothetical protein